LSARTKLALALAGIFLVLTGYYAGRHAGPMRPSLNSAPSLSYSCAMHPFITKDAPGTCPICGMDLVKNGPEDAGDLRMNEHVYLSPSQQVMANLAVTNVMYKPLFKEINASGVIAYDQSRQAKTSAWAPGRIERLYADTVGKSVSKDHPVADLSSPELVDAEEEYLALYHETRPQERTGPASTSPLFRAHQRLRQLGFTDAQFSELERTGTPNVRIPVYPALGGLVISKEVQEGQFVKTGDTLISIADPSQVWAELDVYEDEFSFLKIGQRVVLTSRSYPTLEFSGTITFISPSLDPVTRTVRMRVAVPNQKLLLKPDMLVQARVQVPLGTDLAVPAEAVVVTGSRSLVWVQIKPGLFVPREVKTGVRYRNDIQVLEGLRKDEVVAASGAYLIDSEAQLDTGARPDAAVATRPAATTGPGRQAAMPGKARDEMDMSNMHMEPMSSGTRTGKHSHP